jgi:Rhs element Vgr protein
MPASPIGSSGGVVNLIVKSDGKQIPTSVGVVSVEIVEGFNRIPRCILEIEDGDMPNASFPVSDSDDFKPGKSIVVQAGYGSEAATLFEGIVVRHGLSIPEAGGSLLELECTSKSLAMTVSRNCANSLDKTDSDAITAMLGKYGLTADVEATTFTHKELVQYDCTDWDFMVARAEHNGQLVLVNGSTVKVKAPDASAAAALKVTYGVDIADFKADLDAGTQLKSVDATSWDPSKQAIVTKKAAPASLTGNGNLQAADLSKVLGVDLAHMKSQASLDASVLESWTKARQLKAELSRIRGHVKFQGSALAKTGSTLELAGVGARFNGTVLVTGVRHEIRDGNWLTDATFGMDAEWFTERHQIATPAASGVTGGVGGLQVGVVMKIDADPLNHYRVQVSVPVMQNETDGIWARLSTPYATNAAGFFFVPEIGDEVVLGFFNDDPSHPVVVGSLFSSKLKAPYEIAAENQIKAIVSKNKIKIEFNDDKKILTLSTPGGNTIAISDEGKSILLKDQNGNKVELGESGIVLDSPKDISIKATGAITLDATGKLGLTSKQDLSAKGLNLNLTADVGLTAKGSATAEFSASGQTTVKGAMVMIN